MESSQHTVGVEFGTSIVDLGDARVKLQIWDTAGQERFRAVTRSYYRGAVCTLLVFDISRRETFNNLETWLADARSLTSPTTVFLLVGTKRDLEAQRDITYHEAHDFAEKHGLQYMEVSSKLFFSIFIHIC